MTESFVEVGDFRLWTIAQGRGVPLVLCSGGSGCCDYLGPLAGMLDDLCKVIRFDHRGCGRSDKMRTYTLETCLEDLHAIRHHYGVDRWIMVGHSFGADLSLAYSMRFSEHVHGFICLSGGRVHNDRDWHRIYSERRDQGLEAPPELAYPPNMEMNTQVGRSWKEYIKHPTLFRDLASLTVPALFVYGKQDIRPSWPVEQIAQLLPNAQMEFLETADHQIWVGNEELLKDILREFAKRFAHST